MNETSASPAQEAAIAPSPARRIERAYCIELGRIVGIDEARRLVVENQYRDPLHFECAEPACRDRGIRIAGVNYRFDAEERPKLVSNHFRRLDDHELSCPFYATHDGLPSSNFGARRARALRRDLIEEFIPPQNRSPATAAEPSVPAESHDAGAAASPRRPQRNRYASTSSLERLVDTYRALVSSQVPNAVREYRIRVRGIGNISLAEYVTPVYRARRLMHAHVIYGGARWVKSYGAGFKLRFIDRLENNAAFVYVAPGVAAAGGWQPEVLSLQQGGYCTAYALGSLKWSHTENTLSIDIASTEHLVLRLPRPRPST